jgi:hypothetical protein
MHPIFACARAVTLTKASKTPCSQPSSVKSTPFRKMTSLPSSVRQLIATFRIQLTTTLGRDLIGAYLFGSVAFPEYDPRSGDIDFYVMIRRPLTPTQKRNLDNMHRILSAKFRFGDRLDGFYITWQKARKRRMPTCLPFAANGRLHKGGKDDAWALHRQHLRRGACVVLHGPQPATFLPSASWYEIKKALIAEFSYARRLVRKYPSWSVLNTCRIVYSLEKRDAVVSKIQATQWAMRMMPGEWKSLIHSALRVYLKRRGDQRRLGCGSRAFLKFSSNRICSLSSTELS